VILFNDLQVGNVSTTNMTSCRSITAAVDDMTAALDSCSLKDNSRACSITVNIHQEKVEEKGGRRPRSTKVKLTYARLQVVGCARQGKLVMKDSRVWRILSWMSTPCDMRSFIVWMIAGDRGEGDGEMKEGGIGERDGAGNF